MRDQAIIPHKPHLEIVNGLLEKPQSDSKFTLFCFLPIEIRLIIWEYALQKRRIIRVDIVSAQSEHLPPDNKPEDVNVRRQSWVAKVFGLHMISKLFRVNQESRRVAKAFYRIRMPCSLYDTPLSHDSEYPTECCYINPENDTIHISRIYGPTPEESMDRFLSFLHLTKQSYDPFHVGVLRLALNQELLRIIQEGVQRWYSKRLAPGFVPENSAIMQSFKDTIVQLRELYFVSSRCRRQNFEHHELDWPTFNRSLPIRPPMPAFEIYPQDPRSIQADLGQLLLGENPREMPFQWREILYQLGVSPANIDYHFMLGSDPPSQFAITNRKNATDFVQHEDNEWTGAWRLGNSLRNGNWALRYMEYTDRFFECEIGALHEKNLNEDLTKAVKPAFGFWLFPLKAICEWPSKPEENLAQPWQGVSSGVCSMANHPPALALSFLP
ncbi:hypothetical protein N7488_011406 [Penicillium malachiteum]|nr:hypothetical protein N7488_011406 [Penicillium malachiteum]